MDSNFFAMIFRMKYINRWGLMRNTRSENLSEHSLDVAMIAHALGVIRNKRFGGDINVDRLAVLGIFHDTNEIITGDLPTPIKYYNDDIKSAYKSLEQSASNQILELLPEDLRSEWEDVFLPSDDYSEYTAIVKAADKISALIKCIEEERAGNTEFMTAKKSQLDAIDSITLPEVKVFMQEFLPGFYRTLDEN